MSKFKEISIYSPKKKYKLLPFRFDRLNTNKILLTNLVGEYLYLKESELDDLVNLKLEHSNPSFGMLRSKHFIYLSNEKSPHELLA